MKEAELRSLMKKVLTMYPITPEGFEKESSLQMFKPEFLQQFDRALTWLRQVRPVKNPQHSSYKLKHIAEKEMDGYICNGAMVAAVIALKFPWKRTAPNSKNIWVGVSKRDIKRTGI